MAGSSDLIMIVVLLGAFFLFKDEIMGIFNDVTSGFGGGGGGGSEADIGGDQEMAQTDGSNTDIDIEGEGSGACVNGRCEGSPEAINRAQELLEDVRNRTR